MSRVLLVLLAVTGVPALALPAPVPGTLTFGGVERHYLVVAPEGGARGLVLLLHGHLGDSAHLIGLRGQAAPYRVWRRIAERERLVLVAPDGLRGGDGKTGWNDCRPAASNPKIDDVGFLEALVKKVGEAHRVPAGASYVVGTSNGGVMTLRLAVERPRLFRAFAVLVANMPKDSRCAAPSAPVPILFMDGTADPLMPYRGGSVGFERLARRSVDRGAVLSVDESVALWRRVNHAAAEPRVEELPDVDRGDGSRVVRSSWAAGEGGAPVVLDRVDGGGHTEPSRTERYRRLVTAVLGPQNGDVESAEEIWSFFTRISGK